MRGQTPAIQAALLLLTMLAALACGNQTPSTDPALTPALQPEANLPTGAPAASRPAPSRTTAPNTLEPTPERNAVNTPAPAQTKAATPLPQKPETPVGQLGWTLSPLEMETPEIFLSSVTPPERLCIETNLTRDEIEAMTGMTTVAPLGGIASAIECIGDETLTRLIIQGIVTGKEPLTPGSSACIQDHFDPDSFRALAAMEANPPEELTPDLNIEIAKSLRAALITINCLTDTDWQRADNMYQTDRAVISCILEATGGPEDPENGHGDVLKTLTQAAMACEEGGQGNRPGATREYGTRPDQHRP